MKDVVFLGFLDYVGPMLGAVMGREWPERGAKVFETKHGAMFGLHMVPNIGYDGSLCGLLEVVLGQSHTYRHIYISYIYIYIIYVLSDPSHYLCSVGL